MTDTVDEGIKSVNTLLITILSTISGCILTAIITWFLFGPASNLAAFDKWFVNRREVDELVRTASPWVQDKPYIQKELADLKSIVLSLTEVNKAIARLEAKLDSLAGTVGDIKGEQSKQSDRLLKIERHESGSNNAK